MLLAHRLYSFARYKLFDDDAAHDIASDTLVALWDQCPSFQPQGQFLAFVYAIAKNQIRDYRRRERRNIETACEGIFQTRTGRAIHLVDDDDGLTREPDQVIRGKQEFKKYMDCVSRLPRAQRNTWWLSKHCDLTREEIAEVTRVAPSTAATTIRNAKRSLKDCMGSTLPWLEDDV